MSSTSFSVLGRGSWVRVESIDVMNFKTSTFRPTSASSSGRRSYEPANSDVVDRSTSTVDNNMVIGKVVDQMRVAVAGGTRATMRANSSADIPKSTLSYDWMDKSVLEHRSWFKFNATLHFYLKVIIFWPMWIWTWRFNCGSYYPHTWCAWAERMSRKNFSSFILIFSPGCMFYPI
ncbi:hypothetical protein DEO72_LG7g1941 [Vigna unguiculata]|uniref:Uncharacterized protein n=1 Tax=Vigna unguiculata TaxID=3917 RepID=A0A4D6MIV3_VIGUN|nr:hypothetical protein DEO72_LG7g1941 [Vigna unguiculata]